jgi:23S rRNA G2445 N2-methylase RlmL
MKKADSTGKERILVLTDTGCEEACAQEIGRWVKGAPTIQRNIVMLEATIKDAAVLGYRLQTARRVLIQITDPIDELEELDARKLELRTDLIAPGSTFKADGEIVGNQNFITQELIEGVGGWIHAQLQLPVKLNAPDVLFFAIATDKTYIGLDVIGRTLSKRDWRIMLSRRSLKATVAASTVVYAGATEKDLILDPLADDGTIAIETALYLTRMSPRFYERNFAFERFPCLKGWEWKQDERKEIQKIIAYAANLQEMKAIRTNSKLAGVEKDIHSTKVTIDWVDAKLEERSVDRIITAPIQSGKSLAPQQAAKINEQLFYQAEYIMKKKKSVTCITEKPDELLPAAQKYGFSEDSRREVYMGKRQMTIIIFRKA